MFAAGCGAERPKPAPVGDVIVKRPNGTLVTFMGDVRAWCGAYDDDNPDVNAVHVLVGKRGSKQFWELAAVKDDVEHHPVTTLPNSFVFTEPRGASLFAVDNVPRGNELSSAEEESSGSIRVELDGCEHGDQVRLTFANVVLGSELHDLGSLSFRGNLAVEISDRAS